PHRRPLRTWLHRGRRHPARRSAGRPDPHDDAGNDRMSAIGAVLVRDLRLALRGGGEVFTPVLFLVMIGVIVRLAIGPDRAQRARLAPGLVWIAAFLAMLLGLDRLFRADEEDGSLLLFRAASLPLEAVVAAKMAAH